MGMMGGIEDGMAVIAVFALIAALYLTVKRAVKDALKEYAKETRQG